MQYTSTRRFNNGLLMLGAAALVATSLSPTPAWAQDAGFDARNFRPGAGPHQVFVTEAADTLEHLQVAGGVIIDYASQPLVLRFADDSQRAVIDQQLAAHLLMGLGLFDMLQVDLAMPIYLVNDGAFGGQDIRGATVGDLMLRTKVGFLSSLDGPIGLGAMLNVSVPTGDRSAFVGAAGPSITPMLIADTRFSTPMGATKLTANVGAQLLSESTVHAASVGSQLTFGLGAEVAIIDDLLSLGAEIYGGSQFNNFFATAAASPLEGVLGAKIHTGDGFTILAGSGGGLIGGYGTPDFRAFVGLSYAQPIAEIVEDEPVELSPCPDAPADYDGPVDEDGCPVELVLDCSNLSADYQGAVDVHGCPLLDSDGDGVLDADDVCPLEPEDFDGMEDGSGCPEYDNDNDGIADIDDHCPDEPGLAAHDGCPAPVQVVIREKDQIRITEKVFFETDKAIILPESFNLLEQVGLLLRTNADIKLVEIAGHTDHRGKADHNRALSEERAKAVRDFIIERSRIAPERLTAKGYGFDAPLESAKTEAAMARNRRVEFRILEQETVTLELEVETNDPQ
ncbi:MAG: OmpA family protein [Bradymonadaceae bacterium]|nr:OmpA family protein [Lujinxingiaceae bacterium]